MKSLVNPSPSFSRKANLTEYPLFCYLPQNIASTVLFSPLSRLPSHFLGITRQTMILRLSRGPAILLSAFAAFVVVTFLYAAPSSWNRSGRSITQVEKYTSAPSHLDSYFPPPNPESSNYKEWNSKTLRDLTSCLARKDCGPNQAKIAILANDWFKDAIVGFRYDHF